MSINSPDDSGAGAAPETPTSATQSPETPTTATSAPTTSAPATSTTASFRSAVDAQYRLNLYLILFLGLALLGLTAGIIYLSVKKEALPDVLTSLASLIVGGLLAFLNPVTGSRANLTPPPN